MFLRISRNFLRHWTELQEKLDRDLHNQALDFYAKHPRTIAIKAIRPLAGPGVVGTASAGRASGRAGPHAHLGAVGGRSGGGEVTGDEVQWRPAAVAAAAWGNSARG
jgi:hypothetical protein